MCDAQPESMLIYLTRKCNLRCIMCTTVQEDYGTLPFAAFAHLWPFIPHAKKIQWQGGEVFLVDYFEKLLRRIHEDCPGTGHYITTNGLLINPAWARLLAEVNAELTFSIDSVVPSTYESIRRGGKFDALEHNLELVRDEYAKRNAGRKTTLALHAVVMRRTLGELPLFPEFCRRYGITELRLLYLHPQLVPGEYVFGSDDEKEQLRDAVRGVESRCRELSVNFDYFFRHLLESPPGGREVSMDGRAAGVVKCSRPWTRLFIDTDGTVMPSCECTRPAGNVLENTIEEIWNGPAMRTYRQRIRGCAYEGWCSERCVQGLTNI